MKGSTSVKSPKLEHNNKRSICEEYPLNEVPISLKMDKTNKETKNLKKKNSKKKKKSNLTYDIFNNKTNNKSKFSKMPYGSRSPTKTTKEERKKLLKDFLTSREKPEIKQNTVNIQLALLVLDQSKVANLPKLKKFEKDYYLLNSKGKRFCFCEALVEKNVTPTMFCFRSKNAKNLRTVFDKAGPGLGIYFNFIKSTILFFFTAFLLSIPLQWTNIALYREAENIDLYPKDQGFTSNVYGLITSTTFGVNFFFLLKIFFTKINLK